MEEPASLIKLEEEIPAYFTMSNERLILIARVREETVFFYDSIDRNTTIVLLAQPSCYALKRVFLEVMNDMGATVIDLKEKETFDPSYKISDKSRKIITTLINDYTYDKIITHPRYPKDNDSQNRALFELASNLIKSVGTDNHYTYNKIGINGNPKMPCKTKRGILELYSSLATDNKEIAKEMFQNYLNITANISGLRRVTRSE